MKSKKGLIIAFSAVIVIIAAILIPMLAVGKESYRTISISELNGKVTAENDGKIYDAYKSMNLSDGYALMTASESYAGMVLDEDKYVKLEEESHAVFEALGKAGSGSTVIRLEKGTLTNELTKPLDVGDDYIVHTPNAVLAVRGTFFTVYVRYDENGECYTEVHTYGGTVAAKRVLPDGTVVDEEVLIEAGYKTTIKMDDSDTIYIVSELDGSHENTEPIDPNAIPDDIIVELYDASLNGHEMFLTTDELKAIIIQRNIDVTLYTSKYDSEEIPWDETEKTSAEDTEAVTATAEITTAAQAVPSNDTVTESTAVTTVSEEYTQTSAVLHSEMAETTAAASEATVTTVPPQTDETTVTTPETVPTQTSALSETAVTTYLPVKESEKKATTTTASTTVYTSEPYKLTLPTYITVPVTYPAVTTVTTSETTVTTTVPVSEPAETTVTTSETTVTTTVPVSEPAETTVTTSETTVTTTVPASEPAETTVTTSETTVTTTTEHICVFENYTKYSDATCTANEVLIATCICGETDLKENPDTALGHSFTNYIEDDNATCTENGTKTAKCDNCDVTDTVADAGSATGHSFTNYVADDNATCTEDGTKTAKCDNCNETDVIDDEGTATGHTEVTEDVPATLASDGYYRHYCSVCDTDISEKIIYPRLTSLNASDGDITITATGYTQGDSTEEIPYTGEYTISDSSSAGTASVVTVSGGNPVINISGNNALTQISVSENADAAIKGSGTVNKITNLGTLTMSEGTVTVSGGINSSGTFNLAGTALTVTSDTSPALELSGTADITGGTLNASGSYGMVVMGTLNISGGECNISGTTNGINMWSGSLSITGGRLNCTGYSEPGYYGINNSNGAMVTVSGGSVTTDKLEVSAFDGYTTIVTGGSLRVTDEEISSGIYASTAGEPVSLTVFDTYADYTAAGITGYSLSESDSADDGKYYVWLPATP